MIIDKEKHRIAELENELECCNLVKEFQSLSIKDILRVSGCPSLTHVKDLIEMFIALYRDDMGFNGTEPDLKEAYDGIKNERQDLILKLRDIRDNVQSFLDSNDLDKD